LAPLLSRLNLVITRSAGLWGPFQYVSPCKRAVSKPDTFYVAQSC